MSTDKMGVIDPKHIRSVLQVYTTEELAAAIGVEPATMESWRREGKGPAWCRLGKRVFYRATDVLRWANENQMLPKGDTHDE